MKISLAWLFDHINGDWRKINVQDLVDKFNLKTAEIEGFEKVTLDAKKFTVAKVESIDSGIIAFSPETGKKINLPLRDDVEVGNYYFVGHAGDWASGKDFNSLKECLLPALHFESDKAATKWQSQVDLVDYIFEVDNKSLTHRPDMWGHRGFAREVAALLDLELLPDADFFAQIPIKEYDSSFAGDKENPISSKIETKACKRFSSLYVEKATNFESQLWMAIRLFRADTRAINNFVDLTNYVMLDVGQPMHVFDANTIAGQQLVVRQAQKGEVLELLSGDEIKLVPEDMIILDGSKPVSLAGIKGGAQSGSSDSTESILLESANFDATTIRRASTRHKVRTEASARFEKTLDPNQNILAIERFIKLQQELEPNLVIKNQIISLGSKVAPIQVEFTHEFVENRLGIKMEPQFIFNSLEKLGFGIKIDAGKYVVTVPTWRSSKDVTIPEDVLEEIARMWGYDKIEPVLPSKNMQPGNLSKTFKVRQIKQVLSGMAGMHEVDNYPFYDESFLQNIKWQPSKSVDVKSPVSENWTRLVTSLIPHLCKNIQQNSHDHREQRVFEWGRIWYPKDTQSALEMRILAGIFFGQPKVDFYESKSYLENLFNALNIEVVWQKPQDKIPVWYHPHQTASLVVNGKQIGLAGKLSKGWMRSICDGEAFGFEIDGDFILDYDQEVISFKPLSRYQTVSLDVSLFVPLVVTVSDLQNRIKQVDSRIHKVELVDSFKKDDWQDKKSLTFRYHFVDSDKTLSGEEIAVIQQQVESAVQKSGASVR
jgi:phenylalanyl-tRNA synthetase beta chain